MGWPSQAKKPPLSAGAARGDHFQQALGGEFGREARVGGRTAAERLRQCGVDGARMQREHDRAAVQAGELDREAAQQLVLGGLRSPVGVPAAEPVVADGTDPRRQGREHHGLLRRQLRQQFARQQDRPERIRGERALQARQRDLADRLLGRESGVVQQSGRVDDEVQSAACRADGGAQPGDAGFVGEVAGQQLCAARRTPAAGRAAPAIRVPGARPGTAVDTPACAASCVASASPMPWLAPTTSTRAGPAWPGTRGAGPGDPAGAWGSTDSSGFRFRFGHGWPLHWRLGRGSVSATETVPGGPIEAAGRCSTLTSPTGPAARTMQEGSPMSPARNAQARGARA